MIIWWIDGGALTRLTTQRDIVPFRAAVHKKKLMPEKKKEKGTFIPNAIPKTGKLDCPRFDEARSW